MKKRLLYGLIKVKYVYSYFKGFPGGIVVKNLPANAADVGLIPGSGRSPGGGNGNPLQYSCLKNPMDRGAIPWNRECIPDTELTHCNWWVTVHGASKSWTQLSMHTFIVILNTVAPSYISYIHMYTHTHTPGKKIYQDINNGCSIYLFIDWLQKHASCL